MNIGDVTIPTQVIKYNQWGSKQISQLDCSIHSKLNHKCFRQYFCLCVHTYFVSASYLTVNFYRNETLPITYVIMMCRCEYCLCDDRKNLLRVVTLYEIENYKLYIQCRVQGMLFVLENSHLVNF